MHSRHWVVLLLAQLESLRRGDEVERAPRFLSRCLAAAWRRWRVGWRPCGECTDMKLQSKSHQPPNQ